MNVCGGRTAIDEWEYRGLILLRKIPLFADAEKNNTEDRTADDINYNGKKQFIDVQTSGNFGRWGDVRIDLVSACPKTYDYAELTERAILFARKNKYDDIVALLNEVTGGVDKLGKLFSPTLEYVFYWAYNEKKDIKKQADHAFLLHVPSSLKLVSTNFREYAIKGLFKGNNKSDDLGDKWNSMFLPLNHKELIKHGCLQDLTHLI